jgi:hypothetical protein
MINVLKVYRKGSSKYLLGQSLWVTYSLLFSLSILIIIYLRFEVLMAVIIVVLGSLFDRCLFDGRNMLPPFSG